MKRSHRALGSCDGAITYPDVSVAVVSDFNSIVASLWKLCIHRRHPGDVGDGVAGFNSEGATAVDGSSEEHIIHFLVSSNLGGRWEFIPCVERITLRYPASIRGQSLISAKKNLRTHKAPLLPNGSKHESTGSKSYSSPSQIPRKTPSAQSALSPRTGNSTNLFPSIFEIIDDT